MSWKLIRTGVRRLRAGDAQSALQLLETACKSMPREPRAFVQLGLAQLEACQPGPARLSLQRALEIKPFLPAALYYLALVDFDENDLSAMEARLAELTQVSPRNQALPTLRALLCLRRGEIDQALLHLEIPPCPPSSPFSRPELSSFGPLVSRLAMEVEEWLLPLEVTELKRSRAPADAPLSTPPALPDQSAGQAGSEGGWLTDRVRASIFGMAWGIPLGLLIGLGMWIFLRIAVQDMDYMLNGIVLVSAMGAFIGIMGGLWGLLNPRLPQRYKAYFQQIRGYRFLERALTSQSSSQRRQFFYLAIQNMRGVLLLDPTLLRSHYALGEALLFACSSLHDPDANEEFLPEAEQSFLRSWEQDGENPYLNYYLARCCQLEGKAHAAVTYYQRAIAKFSKLSEGHYGLAQCYLLLGEKVESRRWLTKALGSELQLARDRLNDLGQAFSEGLLARRAPWPELPPEVTLVEESSVVEHTAPLLLIAVAGSEAIQLNGHSNPVANELGI